MTDKKPHRYFLSKKDLIPEISKWKNLVISKKGQQGHVPYSVKGTYSYEGYTMSNGVTVFYRVELSTFRQCVMFKIPAAGVITKYSYKDLLHRTDGPAYIDEHGYAFFIKDQRMTVDEFYNDSLVKESILIDLIKEILDEN